MPWVINLPPFSGSGFSWFGPHSKVTLDERQMKVSVRGVPIALSPLEYRLLAYLLVRQGRVISQQELDENVYGPGEEHASNALEVLVGRVRRKLGVDLIETRRGFGYIVPDRAT